MPISLYDATIPAFRQQLGAISALLDKAEAHCAANAMAPADYINARLIADMLPFNYQVKATVDHSVGAINALVAGVYSPNLTPAPESFAALKEKVTGGLAALDAFTPTDINAFEGRDMRFEFNNFILPFTAENFLLSFSLPNFYFHAATAYDILRHKGLAIGKRDFIGQVRIKS